MLSELGTAYTHGGYQQDRDYYIKQSENGDLLAGRPNGGILNVGGNPTIGYGFDLEAFSDQWTVIQTYLVDALGGQSQITASQQAALDLLAAWKNATPVDLGDGNPPRALRAADINNIVAGRLGTQTQQQALQSFSLTEAQASRLLDDVLDGFNGNRGWEARLSTALAPAGDVPQSQERIALLNMYYNSGGTLIGPGILAALANADPVIARAQAWVEMRYGHILNQNQEQRATDSNEFRLTTPNASIDDIKKAVAYVYRRYDFIKGDLNNNGIHEGTGPHRDPLEAAIQPQLLQLQQAFTQGNAVNFCKSPIQQDRP